MSDNGKPSVLGRVSPTQWVALGVTALAVLFVVQNRTKVSIELLFITIRSPMWLVLLAMFALGWVAGVLTRRRKRG
ncbi:MULTISPECIES: hypothetical protein [unclassified Nocardia]|uniref:hypothetical protein n=1 Tax=unclassified Nocardia TaxID=2637762 RepID=UPI0024A7B24F|nr:MULTISPECIES: hypothetical protein [unclassified Nocardia]